MSITDQEIGYYFADEEILIRHLRVGALVHVCNIMADQKSIYCQLASFSRDHKGIMICNDTKVINVVGILLPVITQSYIQVAYSANYKLIILEIH